jgi:hypothetical protein
VNDERLREAGDPLTSPEWLRLLLRHATSEAVNVVAAGNPNVPVDELRQWLLEGDEVPEEDALWGQCCLAAWHNPATPLLLVTEPQHEYREAARHLLGHLSPADAPRASLGELVSWWHEREERGLEANQAQACSFAHHLAGLFGLPWPSYDEESREFDADEG